MSLEHYAYHFAHLHTARYKGRQAPHKAVLLLAVMRLVGEGKISSPDVELTAELVTAFKTIWAERLPASCPFTCDIGKPFYHMQHEPFWRLVEHDEDCWMVAEELGLYGNQKKDMPNGYSVGAIRQKFRCARIDNALFEVISDDRNRKALEDVLVAKYLTYDPPHNRKTIVATFVSVALCMVA